MSHHDESVRRRRTFVGALAALAGMEFLIFGDANLSRAFDEVSPLVASIMGTAMGAVFYGTFAGRRVLLSVLRRRESPRSAFRSTHRKVRGLDARAWRQTTWLAFTNAIVLPAVLFALFRLEALGTVTALGIFGPIVVAVWAARKFPGILWPAVTVAGALIAAAGVVALTRFWEFQPDVAGLLSGLVAAGCYANYILASDKLEKAGVIEVGMPLAGLMSAVMLPVLSVALVTGLSVFHVTVPGLTLTGDWTSGRVIGITAVSGACTMFIAQFLQVVAFKRISKGLFGVLTASEAIGGLATGWLFLSHRVTALDVAGIALVTVGATAAAVAEWRSQPTQ
jgi:inner membrane transporter RhtA